MIYKGGEIERSVKLVQIQGRGVLRSPFSIRAKASTDRPVVIRAAGERARQIGALLGGGIEEQPVAVAA